MLKKSKFFFPLHFFIPVLFSPLSKSPSCTTAKEKAFFSFADDGGQHGQVPHRRPPVRAVPRALQPGERADDPPHLAPRQRAADHDRGAAGAHREHGPDARRAREEMDRADVETNDAIPARI